MKIERLKDLGIGIVFLVVQIIVFRHLKFFGTQPDIIWLYILWIIATRDRTTAIITAAVLALFQDALLDYWGLNMFAKTATAFFIFNFIPNIHEFRFFIWQVFLIIFGSVLIHNIILLGLSLFLQGFATEFSILQILIGNSLYTAVIGTLLYTIKS